ncbi:TonB-dependent receptor plug domain-containing protein [Sphingosinicella sp.]|uniref:TonB-dependent receptor plug domain-containing protein n=1 Tax=Sphingosinicella sp. TaxID=1917971 RepID=UPI00403785E5
MNLSRAQLLSTLSLLGLSVGSPALAQPPAETAAADDQAIIVTGTRRTDRTVADSPVPIDVITSDALSQSGYTETNRLLNQLVPSFNFPQPSITDGTDTVRPATLRGLSPDQTLVLINGRRRHPTALLNINGSVGRGSAAVDLNLIPAIAISRVEVLRDGAAAQYGSDAIAGVINFQMSTLREGARFAVTAGQYRSSVEGIPEVTGVATGAGGEPVIAPDGTLVLINTGRDRRVTDGETYTIAGLVGIPLGPEGHITIAADYQDRAATNRTGYDPRRQYNLVGGVTDPREFTFNRLSHRYGDARTDDMRLFVNAGLPLGEAIELYGFISYATRDGNSGAFYRLANDARNIPAIYPNGFLPNINTELEDASGTLGLRGELGGFRYDLSATRARNAFDFTITNTLNRSLGPTSPQRFDSGGLRYTHTLFNLDLTRQLAVSFFENLTLAAGLEYREETFRVRSGEPNSYIGGAFGGASGAQGFPGFAPVIGGQAVNQRRERHNISAYAELDADVSDNFTVQIAGRYEDYNDFGSDINGKIAARFEPVQGLALRGAISTGFRAPSLQQQFFAAQATNNVGGVLLETVTLPVDNPIAIALGATPLEPETSISYSAGLVFNMIQGLNVTLDVYQVDIDDRIVVTDNLTATRDAAGNPSGADPGRTIAQILNNAGFRSTNAARFFVNGVDTRTRGFDAIATYRWMAGNLGRLTFTAGYNYNETDLQRILAAPGPLANVPGLILFGRQEQIRLTDGQPRSRINFGIDFERGRFELTARANRYGRVLAAGLDPFLDVQLEAKWVADLEARLRLGEHVSVAIGSNNIFDEYPTIVPTGRGVDPVTGAARNYPATNYVAPWSAFSPFGFNGRFVYARLGVRF